MVYKGHIGGSLASNRVHKAANLTNHVDINQYEHKDTLNLPGLSSGKINTYL